MGDPSTEETVLNIHFNKSFVCAGLWGVGVGVHWFTKNTNFVCFVLD